jgi:alkyldihydroxyacetonephosphate synthase
VFVLEGANEDELAADAATVERFCARFGAQGLGEGPARDWYRKRYAVSYRQPPVFRTGAFNDTMEVAAPWSRLPAVYHSVRSALGSEVVVMAHLSHAYPDGACIYFTFSGTAPSERQVLELYERSWKLALEAALSAGATLSHHHGVGVSKAPRLRDEWGAGVEVLRALKRAWDPDGVLNPGVLLPDESSGVEPSSKAPATTDRFELDARSQLLDVSAECSLDEAENVARRAGLTLGLSSVTQFDTARSLGDWSSAGCPGSPDPFQDPVRHSIAGYVATLGQQRVVLGASPRRAVGPDLSALIIGARGELGHFDRLVLSLARRSAHHVQLGSPQFDRNSALGESEQRAWKTLVGVLGRAEPGK